MEGQRWIVVHGDVLCDFSVQAVGARRGGWLPSPPSRSNRGTPNALRASMRVPLRTLSLACSALFAALVGACAAPADDASSSEAAVTTEALASKKELFAQDLLFVRVTGWAGDPDDLKNLRDSAKLGDAELRIFKADPRSGEHCPSSGALVYASKAFSLRTSGNLTNGTAKSSYKVSLEDKEDKLFGMRAINLKSMWNDVSQMRESLAWGMFARAGVVAPRHTYAKLCVDGQKGGQSFTKYMGLYSVIEQVDKAFVRDHLGKKNDGGNLYKQYWPQADLGPATLGYRSANGDDSGQQYKKNPDNDQRTYRLKTNDGANDAPSLQTYDDLATLIRVLNGVTTQGDPAGKFDTPEYTKNVEEVFNAKQFLRWAAMSSLLGAWDNYWATPANYYLYNSGRKGGGEGEAFMERPYFTWIPWDYDNSLGTDFTGASWAEANIIDWSGYDGRTSNMGSLPALRHLFKNRTFLAYYLDAIEHLNGAVFTIDGVRAEIARTRPRVEKAAFLEGNFGEPAHTGRQFTNDEVSRHGFEHHELRRGSTFVLGIEHFVRIRHDSVARQLARIREARNLPRGASGATFPALAEELPR
jgi:spore coat protein CotH